MKTNLLMPHVCKTVGLIIMLPLAAAWLVFLFFNGESGILSRIADILNEHTGIFVALLALSMIMAAFSREKDEDEYVASIRGKYLMLAFYADFVFLVITSFLVYDLDYLYIMAIQMFLILFLHIVMFNAAMAVIRRRRGRDEE